MHIRDGAQSYTSTHRPHPTFPIRCPGLPTSKPFWPETFWLLQGMLCFTGCVICQNSVQIHSPLWNPFEYQYLFIIYTFQLSDFYTVIFLRSSWAQGMTTVLQCLWFYHRVTLTLVAMGLRFGVRLQETSLLKNHLIILRK